MKQLLRNTQLVTLTRENYICRKIFTFVSVSTTSTIYNYTHVSSVYNKLVYSYMYVSVELRVSAYSCNFLRELFSLFDVYV